MHASFSSEEPFRWRDEQDVEWLLQPERMRVEPAAGAGFRGYRHTSVNDSPDGTNGPVGQPSTPRVMGGVFEAIQTFQLD
jgi:hypothetical protein